jgi:hypothetical protein
LLQDLLRGIAEMVAIEPNPKGPGLRADAGRASPFGPTGLDGFRQRALVVAEEAIRIDPASASLRQAATELQRAADATDPDVRSKALAAASVAAAAEARRAHADPPLAPASVAPGLSGAFADAMSRQESRR